MICMTVLKTKWHPLRQTGADSKDLTNYHGFYWSHIAMLLLFVSGNNDKTIPMCKIGCF